MLQKVMEYYGQHTDAYWQALQRHITISLEVVIISIIIGVPLGIACAKWKKSAKFISGFVNFLRVVPSLALMVILIPLMGIGRGTAIVALTLIATPSIMINTTAGFLSIEPMVLEVAKGMGMNPVQSFRKVECPLAFPLILTGIRTSAVEAVASTSIAAYIGAGGLGDLVFAGLGMNKTEIVLLGGGSIAILSVAIDIILAIYQTRIGKYMN